jgi:hypothetical protein
MKTTVTYYRWLFLGRQRFQRREHQACNIAVDGDVQVVFSLTLDPDEWNLDGLARSRRFSIE